MNARRAPSSHLTASGDVVGSVMQMVMESLLTTSSVLAFFSLHPKPLHTSPALISFLEKHAAAGNFSSQLCHTALETEFCTIFFSLAELWNVAVGA